MPSDIGERRVINGPSSLAHTEEAETCRSKTYGTENRSCFLAIKGLWNRRNMTDIRDDILREGSVNSESTILTLLTTCDSSRSVSNSQRENARQTLLEAFSALFTIETRVREPLNSYTITKLDWRVLSVCANGNNDTNSLRHSLIRHFCLQSLLIARTSCPPMRGSLAGMGQSPSRA